MNKRNYWTASESMRIYFLCLIVFLTVSFLPYFLASSALRENAVFSWIVSGFASLSLALTVYFCSKVFKVDFLSAEKLNVKPDAKQILLGLGLTVALLIFMLPVVNMFNELIVKLGFPEPSGTEIGGSAVEIILAVIFACFIAAFTEEVFVRGAVTGGLAGCGKIGASLISGFAFMLFHMNPANTVYQFVFGFILAYLYLSSGSLWVPISMHFFNNLLSIVLSFVVPENLAVLLFDRYWWASMAVGAVLIAVFFYLFKAKTPDRFDNFIPRNEFGEKILTKPSAVDVTLFSTALLICAGMWVLVLVNG